MSGWVSKPFEIKAGQRLRVPTGLFRFRDITHQGLRSTVPQKLYHGDEYLVTGYQGMTARLHPGTYTVRYHLPTDEKPARSLRQWHIIGPFPAKSKKDVDLQTACPPEETPSPDLRKGCTVAKRKYTWQRVNGPMTIDLRQGRKEQGVVYLATTIDSPSQREAELTFMCREALKVWLNGKLLKTVLPARRYAVTRTETWPTLRKGKNLLLVKTFVRNYTHWPFTALMEGRRTYQAVVRDDQGKPGPTPSTAASAVATAAQALPPVKGIKGIVFCQVPNLPNGACGLHYEQFRIVTRPSKARICTLIPAAPNGKYTDLTSKHFAGAMQPDISYDGTKIVFSARKTAKKDDLWNIYEMSLDGSGLRQVTRNMGICLDPCYLPNGRIVYSSTWHSNFMDEYDRDPPRCCTPATPTARTPSRSASTSAATPPRSSSTTAACCSQAGSTTATTRGWRATSPCAPSCPTAQASTSSRATPAGSAEPSPTPSSSPTGAWCSSRPRAIATTTRASSAPCTRASPSPPTRSSPQA